MPIHLDLNHTSTTKLSVPIETAFAYCSDVERSIPANFPGLEKFEKIKDDVYRWAFKKIAFSNQQLNLQLVTRFDRQPMTRIRVTPVEVSGTGTSSLKGEWHFEPLSAGCQLTFGVQLSTELPLPFLLKAVVAPIAQSEIAKIFDRYLQNVAKELSQSGA